MLYLNFKNRLYFALLIGFLLLFYTGCGSNKHNDQNITQEVNQSINNTIADKNLTNLIETNTTQVLDDNQTSMPTIDKNVSNDISYIPIDTGGNSNPPPLNQTTPKHKISGLIQKGRFISGTITAQQVDTNGNLIGKIISSPISNKGNYNITLEWDGLTLLTASGYFFDEISNQKSKDIVKLSSLIKYKKDGSYNINILTDFQQARVLTLMQNGVSYSKAILKEKDEIEKYFDISTFISPQELDMFNFTNRYKNDNFNLFIISSTLLNIYHQSENNPIKKLSRVQQKVIPIGSNNLQKIINSMKRDFSKDGKIDDEGKTHFRRMVGDDAVKTFNKAKKNLGLNSANIDKFPNWTDSVIIDLNQAEYIYDNNGVLKYLRFEINSDTHNGISVSYSTQDSSAKAGQDYTSVEGSVTFDTNHKVRKIDVPILRRGNSNKTFNFIIKSIKFINSNSMFPYKILTDKLIGVIPAIKQGDTHNSATNFKFVSLKLTGVDTSTYTKNSGGYFFIHNPSTTLHFTLTQSADKLPDYFYTKIYLTDGKRTLDINKTLIVTNTNSYFFALDLEDNNPILNFINQAQTENRDVKLVAKTTLTDSGKKKTFTISSLNLPKFAKLDNKLIVNGTKLPINLATYKGSCSNHSTSPFELSQYAKFDMDVIWKPSDNWSEVDGELNDGCVRLDFNSYKFTPTLVDGNISIDSNISSNDIGGNNSIELMLNGIFSEGSVLANISSFINSDGTLQTLLSSNGNTITSPKIFIKFKLSPDQSLHIGINKLVSPINLLGLPIKMPFFGIEPQKLSDSWDDLHIKQLMPNFNFYLHSKDMPIYLRLSGDDIILDNQKLHFTNLTSKYIQTENELISNDSFFSDSNNTFNITLDKNSLYTDSNSSPIIFKQNSIQTDFPFAKISFAEFSGTIVDGRLNISNPSISSILGLNYEYTPDCAKISCSINSNKYQLGYMSATNPIFANDGSMAMAVKLNSNKKVKWGKKNDNQYAFEKVGDSDGQFYVPGYTFNVTTPKDLVASLLGSRDMQNKQLKSIHLLNQDSFNRVGNGLFAGLNMGKLYLKGTQNDPLKSLAGTQTNVKIGKTTVDLNNNDGTKYYIRPSGVTGIFNGTLTNSSVLIYNYPISFRRFAFAQVANTLDKKTWIDGLISLKGNAGFDISFSNMSIDCSANLNNGHIDECTADNSINCQQSLSAWKTATKFVSIGFDNKNGADSCSNADKVLKVGHILDIKALSKPLGLTTTWLPSGEAGDDATITGATDNYLDKAENNNSSTGFSIAIDSNAKLKNKGWYKLTSSFGLPFWGIKPTDLALKNKGINKRDKSIVKKKGLLESQNSYQGLKSDTLDASYEWGTTGLGFSLPVYYKSEEQNKESIFLGKTKSADLKVMSAKAGINYIQPNRTKISFGASADFNSLANLKINIDLNDPKSLKEIDDVLSKFGIGNKPLQSTIGLILNPLHQADKYVDKGMLLGMEELGIKALETIDKRYDPFEKLANTFAKIHALPTKTIDLTEDFIENKINGIIDKINDDFNALKHESDNKSKEALKKGLLSLLDQLDKNVIKLDTLKSGLLDINNTLRYLDFNKTFADVNSTINTLFPSDCSQSNAIAFFKKQKFFSPIIVIENNMSQINKQIQAMPMDMINNFAQSVAKQINFNPNDLKDTFEKAKILSKELNSKITQGESLVNSKLVSFCNQSTSIRAKVQLLIDKSMQIDIILKNIQKYINDVYSLLDKKIPDIKALAGDLKSNDDFNSTKLVNYRFDLSSISSSLKNTIDTNMKVIPEPTANELRRIVITTILDTKPIEELRVAMNDIISPIMDEVRNIAVDLISSANNVVYDVLKQLSKVAQETLAKATSVVKKMPLKSAEMDGYAHIAGDEVERVHIGAKWAIDTGNKDTSYSFNGALDMARWSVNGKAGCGGNSDNDSNMDVKISTRDIKMDLGPKKLSIDRLYFGFTLAKAIPVGIMGGVESKAGFDFNTFKLYDMALAAGIGTIETYLGAKSSAIFEQYQLQVAFLLGKTCGKEIIMSLDPEVGKFITLPQNVFKGAYIRGGASFPIWNNGCALTVGVSADMGVWLLIPGTYGGLIGGGAYGQALCIASLKGAVKTMFEKSGDTIKFAGSGWGAAGVGWCEPSTWSSVSKSRRDSWCGTGDAQFGASYNNGWHLDTPSTSAVH